MVEVKLVIEGNQVVRVNFVVGGSLVGEEGLVIELGLVVKRDPLTGGDHMIEGGSVVRGGLVAEETNLIGGLLLDGNLVTEKGLPVEENITEVGTTVDNDSFSDVLCSGLNIDASVIVSGSFTVVFTRPEVGSITVGRSSEEIGAVEDWVVALGVVVSGISCIDMYD